jgi:hypothetical protein
MGWAITGLCVLLSAVSVASGRTVVSVSNGDGAPDGNGTFSELQTPVLNDSGQTLVQAALSGSSGGASDNAGVYRISDGLVTQIVRKGQAAPDGNGTYSDLIFPVLNGSGQAAWLGELTGTSGGGDDNAGIFRGSGGTVTRIAREGQAAPDGNGTFLNLFGAALNNLGQVGFYGGLSGVSPGGSEFGIFRGSGGALTRIIREGQSAPDGDGTFSAFDGFVMNNAGQAAFWGQLDGSIRDSGYFRGSGGAIARIVREGQAAPDGNGMFSGFSSACSLNDSGGVAFRAILSGTAGGDADDVGVFSGYGGGLTQIARAGQGAPDGNGVFDVVSDPVLNNSAQAVFTAILTATSGGSSDNRGLYRGTGGVLTQLARAGQAAPDGNGTFSYLEYTSLNDWGHTAFHASLANTIGADLDDTGIYISDGVDLIQVAREGQTLDGSTITGLALSIFDGICTGINESGQVAYGADLADGRDVAAVFTPEIHWRSGGGGYWQNPGNWTLGIAPAPLYDVVIDPAGSLSVTADYLHTTVKSLTVGSNGGGIATLLLDNDGDLAAVGEVGITDGGRIDIGAGRVLSAGLLTNSGVLSGSGTVQAPLLNNVAGEVRVSWGQRMVIASSNHLNVGKIEVIGGEIEFIADLLNGPLTGLITGRDATLRFRGGLTNDGSVALGLGTSDLHGDITNMPDGRIVVSGASEATFYDDVLNAGAIQVSGGSTALFFGDFSGNGCAGTGDVFLEGDTRPGFSAGEMNFGGNVAFGPFAGLEMELGGTVGGDEYDRLEVAGDLTPGGTLQVVLIDDFTPDIGDTFDILDWGTLTGAEFDLVELPGLVGRKAWDTSGLYTDGEISVIGMLDGDTDVDWDVDSDDLVNLAAVFGEAGDWRTDFNGDGRIDLTDFALMRANFGAGVGSSPSGATGASTPEPASAVLLLLGLGAVIRRRRK